MTCTQRGEFNPVSALHVSNRHSSDVTSSNVLPAVLLLVLIVPNSS